MANIHDDIMAMPMNYNTLVGDMGASLSGGQKQRVLLATAFYRKPDVLFLDEAPSHLDIAGESIVNEHITASGHSYYGSPQARNDRYSGPSD